MLKVLPVESAIRGRHIIQTLWPPSCNYETGAGPSDLLSQQSTNNAQISWPAAIKTIRIKPWGPSTKNPNTILTNGLRGLTPSTWVVGLRGGTRRHAACCND